MPTLVWRVRPVSGTSAAAGGDRTSEAAAAAAATVPDPVVSNAATGPAVSSGASAKCHAGAEGRTEKKRAINAAEAATAAKKKYKATSEHDLPPGVYKISSTERFQSKIQWGGKQRYIGTFGTTEQASAAYVSVRDDLDDTELSALGIDEVNALFEAAKTKAVEAEGGFIPRKTAKTSGRDLPTGVSKTSSGTFHARLQWGDKRHSVGTFDTPEQASAALVSVRKDRNDTELSALGADEVNALFDAAQKKAVEAVAGVFNPRREKSNERDNMCRDRRGIAETSSREVNACYPHNPPSEAAAKCYQGEDMVAMMHTQVPELERIVNYPSNYTYRHRKAGEDRRCVMCGKYCSTTRRRGQAVIIPNQNKGVCTACDTTVWIHAASGLQIKWCKGCKTFKTWAKFGHKGHLTKCMWCRDDQSKRYARQKTEKTVTVAVDAAKKKAVEAVGGSVPKNMKSEADSFERNTGGEGARKAETAGPAVAAAAAVPDSQSVVPSDVILPVLSTKDFPGGGKKRKPKRPWSTEEDAELLRLVKTQDLSRIKWSKIAKGLGGGRLGKRCRERYYNHLDPAIKREKYTAEEDEKICAEVAEIGTKWTKIAALLPGRTETQIKNRWYSTLKRKVASGGFVTATSKSAAANQNTTEQASAGFVSVREDLGQSAVGANNEYPPLSEIKRDCPHPSPMALDKDTMTFARASAQPPVRPLASPMSWSDLSCRLSHPPTTQEENGTVLRYDRAHPLSSASKGTESLFHSPARRSTFSGGITYGTPFVRRKDGEDGDKEGNRLDDPSRAAADAAAATAAHQHFNHHYDCSPSPAAIFFPPHPVHGYTPNFGPFPTNTSGNPMQLPGVTTATDKSKDVRRQKLYSNYTGVTYSKLHTKYQACVTHYCKQHHLGRYELAVDAARAYDESAKLLKGYAWKLNFGTVEEYELAKKRELEHLMSKEHAEEEAAAGGAIGSRKKKKKVTARDLADIAVKIHVPSSVFKVVSEVNGEAAARQAQKIIAEANQATIEQVKTQKENSDSPTTEADAIFGAAQKKAVEAVGGASLTIRSSFHSATDEEKAIAVNEYLFKKEKRRGNMNEPAIPKLH